MSKDEEESIISLHQCIRDDDVDTLRHLLDHYGSDVADRLDETGTSPLHLCADLNRVEVCQVLVQSGHVNVRVKNERFGWTALHLAAYQGHHDIVSLLLAEDKTLLDTLNVSGNSALHFAALNGRRQCVDVLLEHEADVNLADDDGDTPLHMAAVNNHTDVIAMLVARGAKVQQNKAKQTPLMLGHEAGHRNLITSQFSSN